MWHHYHSHNNLVSLCCLESNKYCGEKMKLVKVTFEGHDDYDIGIIINQMINSENDKVSYKIKCQIWLEIEDRIWNYNFEIIFNVVDINQQNITRFSHV